MKAFVSWSGGKDSALAYYRASHIPGIDIKWLLTMFTEDGDMSRSPRPSLTPHRLPGPRYGHEEHAKTGDLE